MKSTSFFLLSFLGFLLASGCQCATQEPSESIADAAQEKVEAQREETDASFVEKKKEEITALEEIVFEEANEIEQRETSPEKWIEEAPQTASLSFRVLSNQEDIVPPRLKSLNISPTSIKAGELLQISAETEDDLSGVSGVQLTLASPNQKHSLYLSTVYNPSKQRFVGQILIPRYAESGQWEIVRATLQDRAGNPSVYLKHQAPLDQAKWIVQNDSPDTEAAALAHLHLQATQAKAGEDLWVLLEIAPDPSGIKQIQIAASGDQGGYIEAIAFFHPQQKRYEAYLPIPSQGPDGLWSIVQVRIEDQAENVRVIGSQDPLLAQKTFTVSGSVPKPPPTSTDTSPPIIQALHLSDQERKTKELIHILLQIQDRESGVARSRVTLADPSGADRLFIDVAYNAARALWEGSIEIPAYARDGLWTIRTISATDHAGNTSTLEGQALSLLPALPKTEQLTKNAAFATLSVSPSTEDRSPPTLLGMRIAPGEISAAEDARLYLALRDPSGRGIASASCTARGPQPTLQKRVLLHYNADTGFYEGNFGFHPTDALGEWWISGCYLTNQIGRSASIDGGTLKKVPSLDISRATQRAGQDPFAILRKGTAPPPVSDQQPPQLKSYQISKAQIQVGEILRVYAVLEDAAEQHTLRLRCRFQSERNARHYANNQVEATLTYRAATKRFEGELSISAPAVEGAWWIQECVASDPHQNTIRYERNALAELPRLTIPTLSNPPTEHRGWIVQASSPPPVRPLPTIEGVAVAPLQQKHGSVGRVFLRAKEQEALAFAFCAIKPPVEEEPQMPYLSAQLSWNPFHRLWEGNFLIPSHAYAGLWTISRCQITDLFGGSAQISDIALDASKVLDLSMLFPIPIKKQIALEVTQGPPPPTKDTTPPSLQSLRWLPSDQVEAGGTATLQIAAEDTDSGIASISAQLQSPNQKAVHWLSFQKNTAEQRWEAEQLIPLYKEDGAWQITQLTLTDQAGNQKSFSSTDPEIQIPLYVSKTRSLPEQDPPVLLTLSRSQATLLGGESTRFLAEIRDASPIQQVFLQVQAPSGKQQQIPLSWNPATSRYEGDIAFSEYAETGLWKVSTFLASDIYENILRLPPNDPRVTALSITLRRAPQFVDNAPPTLGTVMLTSTQSAQGATLRLLAQLTDAASGVAQASAILQHTSSGKQLWSVLQYNPASTLYEGNFVLPTDAEIGIWKITQIDVSDVAQNTKRYTTKDPELQ